MARAAAAAAVLAAAWAAPAAPPHLLEEGVVPARVCAAIIAAAEENGGAWNMDGDTIDRADAIQPPSVQIEVFQHGEVRAPSIMALLEPYLDGIAAVVDRAKRLKGLDGRASVDWIFLRKYVAGGARDRLRAHRDGNEHSANVFLNDEDEWGRRGGLFLAPDEYGGGAVVWSDEYLESNAADAYYPPQSVGGVLVHDSEVWHGIAPIAYGVKSHAGDLSFFFF